jgi:SagB-type dehydrogenase family enzyme
MHLDPTSFPAWRERLQQAEASGEATPRPPRSYPGHPTVALPPYRARWWPPSLDRLITRRRSSIPGTALPSPETLGHLLTLSHGVTGEQARGPVPSAGGFQALELYLGVLTPGWLGAGVWHYQRMTHSLARVADATKEALLEIAPSLQIAQGGAVLWLIVGDTARVRPKYGERGLHFLTLEAGHLMQNLCLVSASLGLVTLPLGGYFENALARLLRLLPTDEVLYLGVCGPAAGA